jgi:hypothetical protein
VGGNSGGRGGVVEDGGSEDSGKYSVFVSLPVTPVFLCDLLEDV